MSQRFLLLLLYSLRVDRVQRVLQSIQQDGHVELSIYDIVSRSDMRSTKALLRRLGLQPPFSVFLIFAARNVLRADTEEEEDGGCLALATEYAKLVDQESSVNIFSHLLTCFRIEPIEALVELTIEFVRCDGALPTTLRDLREFHRRQEAMRRDMDMYCERYRHSIRTPDLDHLRAIRNVRDDLCCSICQEHIDMNTWIYQLQPCGDCFHSTLCLEHGNIVTWLEQNRRCPNCKQEVHVLASASDLP